MKFEAINNPFAVEVKPRKKRRSWNNDVKGLVKEFEGSSLDCAHIPHDDYYGAAQLLYSLNSSIKCLKCDSSIEAHMYKGNVYLFKSKAIDREKMHNYYKRFGK